MAASIALTASASSGTDASSYTFSAQALGLAASDRKIVVALTHNANPRRSISSVSVGGVSASAVLVVPLASFAEVALYIADVPTGTTGDVVVNLSGTTLQCAIAVYRVVGVLSSTAYATASQTPSAGSGQVTTTLNVPAGGISIGATVTSDGSSWDWSAGLTEDSDQFPESQIAFSSASGAFGSAQTPLTVTATCGTGTRSGLAVASWDMAPTGGQPAVKRFGGVPFASPNRGVW